MNNFHLTLLDSIIIIAEILVVVVVGLLAARKVVRTTEGYFLASGKMPWYLIGAAFVSTSVSSEQIVGTIGATYKGGLAIANWEWWCLPTYTLMMVFFIPLYLRNKIVTVPELLNRRFGPACGAIYSCVILVGYVFIFLPPVLYGGSLTLGELTGWPQWAVLAGILLLTASYTLLGGLSSVMWTDAIQCVMLIGGGVLLFLVALGKIPGGWEAMTLAAPDRFHLYRPASDEEAPFAGLILASFGVFLFYQSSNQVMVQRILSARSTWDGMMGLLFAGFINIIRPMVTCLLGLIVYHWLDVMRQGPSLLPDNQDQAFPYALAVFAPSGLRGVILAGFFAAVMASVSALTNSVATIFSLDVYRRFWRKKAGDKELITTGQVSGGMALMIAALISPVVANVGMFKYFQTGVTYMATPFISVLLMGIFWKRTTYAGAIAGMLGGLAIQIALAVLFWALDLTLNWLYVAAIAQVLTMALITFVSYFTTPPTSEQYKPFLWKFSWLRDLEDGMLVRPWWQQIKFWFAIYAVAWFFIYWRFW
ncbi:SSS family solute:Na+ symporter [Larkinella arboricola]|uniref:SSS family solute:Na+ symporter n=1 Tax=Larkinella arboricola TaxID=643671 RepID=A0A327WNQ2_LARAB|nr:sodium/solute symporter [Larkinella arboricola]RAJ93225.1 SSS family solute:Na+ symporter [Larkinella arboricola]